MILYKEPEDFKGGALILVDKPLQWTSFDVVNKLRWCLKGRCGKLKVGHAGTLDPLATGLVIICTGEWTKGIAQYEGQSKEYLAEIRFGVTTPSFDLETEVDSEYPYLHIDKVSLEEVLKQFIGELEQVPPIFSAVHIDGVRAYKKARQGDIPTMQARTVTIHEIELLQFALPIVTLRIVCGKGTYIRSLARDIGLACGSGATLSGLRRTHIGDFSVDDAENLDDLVAQLQKKC
ncbi:tRNA pseudouridine synthase B [Bacteroidia bacterium]|nr:tRNA pseudouridine synthase B [Bacteroidia bacterium]